MPKYKAEVLSPVHIGTGNTLTLEDDIDVFDGRVYRVQMNKLLTSFTPEQMEQAANALGKKGVAGIVDYAIDKGVDVNNAELYQSPVYGAPRQITEMFAGGLGPSPMVPATSIKGAVRSSLIWWMLKSNPDLLKRAADALLRQGRPRRLEFTDDAFDKSLVGSDPNHDIGRLFSFGDSPELPWEQIEIASVVVEVPRSGSKIEHKILPKGSTRALNDATMIHVESLKAGTAFESSFRIDTRLMSEKSLGWQPYQISAIQQLPRACNEHARALIVSRLAFWTHYGVAALVDFYSGLKAQVEGLIAANNGTFVLPVGWGTGLQTKTIMDLFSPTTQLDLANDYGQRSGDRVHAKCGSFVDDDPNDPSAWYCPQCKVGGLLTDRDVWAPAKSHKVCIDQTGQVAAELGWMMITVEMPSFGTTQPQTRPTPTPRTPEPPIRPQQTQEPRPQATTTQKPQPQGAPTGRSTGTVKSWGPDKPFGFIIPDQVGKDVFVHLKDLPAGVKELTPGQKISYEVRLDEQKRPQATSVKIL
ncbi:MAG: type III-A CRISPR-associated RAMP protein Csm5 [Candidatus Jacksonbacteria bacterium RIFOXYA2_FULL_43_12]|nr:MAG: type III-A CRISPR-associated RAMP protein Csm5 [Candidatus Jacksonbacteria bacterium RIFOXYA2_FULL_43_12]